MTGLRKAESDSRISRHGGGRLNARPAKCSGEGIQICMSLLTENIPPAISNLLTRG